MRVDVSFKNMGRSQYLDDIIDSDIEKIKSRMKIFKQDDAIHFSLHLEKNPHREQYLAWANLYLPRRVLKAQQQSKSASTSINKVSSALLRQVDKYKVMVEKHLQRKKRILDND